MLEVVYLLLELKKYRLHKLAPIGESLNKSQQGMLVGTYIDQAHAYERVDELCIEFQLLLHLRWVCVIRLDPLLVVVVPIQEAREELFVLKQVDEKLGLIESEPRLGS